MGNYNDCTDEQLVEKYKSGDNKAFDEIFSRYRRVIRAEANKYFLRGGNTDDLLQEATIGLAKAVGAYDGQGSSFKTFAYTCIKNNVINAVVKYSKKSNMPLNEGVPLESSDANSIKVDDPLIYVIESETEKEQLSIAKSKLSKNEIIVLDYALEGYNYVEIAEKLGKNPKSIDNALQRIRNKLKK